MELIPFFKKLREARQKHSLTAMDQNLFFELIYSNHLQQWIRVFHCSTKYLCKVLNMSERTLRRSRQRLMEAGLLFCNSGKTVHSPILYSFVCEVKTFDDDPEENNSCLQETDKNPSGEEAPGIPRTESTPFRSESTVPRTESTVHRGEMSPHNNESIVYNNINIKEKTKKKEKVYAGADFRICASDPKKEAQIGKSAPAIKNFGVKRMYLAKADPWLA